MSRPLKRRRVTRPAWPHQATVSQHAIERWCERGGLAETGWTAEGAFARAYFIGHVPHLWVYQVGPWLFAVKSTRAGWVVLTVIDARKQDVTRTEDGMALTHWVRAHLATEDWEARTPTEEETP